MKKILSLILAVMMLASLSVLAFAADLDKQENKPDANPNSDDGNLSPEVPEVSIEIYGYDKPWVFDLLSQYTELPEDATDAEKTSFEEKNALINEVIKMLEDEDALKKAVSEAVTVPTERTIVEEVYDRSEDAVYAVADVYYFDAKDSDGNSVLASEYKEEVVPSVKALIKMQIPQNLVKVVQRVGETWVEIPVVLNDQDENTIEVSYSGVFAFVYNSAVELG